MDTRVSETSSSKSSIIYTPKPIKLRRCDTTSTWSSTKISTGWRKEIIIPKCPFALVKGRSVNLDQHLSLEELDKEFSELNSKSDLFDSQVLSILTDSNYQERFINDSDYEIVERVRNPFYQNLELDE